MIKLFTDSSADIPKELIEKYNIYVFPMSVVIGDKEYRDQIDLSNEVFYDRLRNEGFFAQTAYPAVGYVYQKFAEELKEGNQIIMVTISEKLSGFHKAVNLMADNLGRENFFILNSKAATITEGLIVLEIAKAIERGLSFQELQEFAINVRDRARGYGVVGSLDCLLKGGRISVAKAIAANALNVKPIIEITPDGGLEMAAKVRGFNKGCQWTVKKLGEKTKDYRNTSICIAYSSDIDKAYLLKDMIIEAGYVDDCSIWRIGPTVGTHLGLNACGIFYIEPQL